LVMPSSVTSFGSIRTDASKKLIGTFGWQYEARGNRSASTYQIQPGISLRPFSALKVGVTADYSQNRDELQYVAAVDYLADRKYILGTIDQKTLGLTFRVDVNISPEFSIQYYGSPFVSKGSYSVFRYITDPVANSYSGRYLNYEHFSKTGTLLLLDQDDDYKPDITIGNPDFNFYQFRSNLVAKWEYRLGSFIYFVWSTDRTGSLGSADGSLGSSLSHLGSTFPNNIFLIKLNYWFSL
ncbi:MAG: DUF5916 domain-containing protein, partial [Chloroflexota bacterium]